MSKQNPLATSASASFGLLLARLPVGAVLTLHGYKLLRVVGVQQFVMDNLSMVDNHLPEGIARAYLTVFPYACLVLGLMLILGLLTRASGLMTAVLLGSLAYFRSGIHGFVNTNPQFAQQLLNAPAVYSVFGLIALFAGPGRFSLDHLLFRRKHAHEIDQVNEKYGH